MSDFGFLSIIPPVVSIALALIYKNVFVALSLGCLIGFTILANGNIFVGIDTTLMSFIKVFEDNDNVIVIIVVALLGGLTYLMEKSGGINGFVDYMTKQRQLITSKKGANLFTWLVGILVFTSGTVSTLVTGAISRPINDALKVPHEKSAFIVHTTSTPVCVLIPLSGWGAYMIGLLQAQGVENAPIVLARSIPLNFYCVLAVLAIPLLTLMGKDFGPMKHAEIRAQETGLLDEPKGNTKSQEYIEEAATTLEEKTSSAANLIVPILSMIVIIISGLLITGKGKILEGNGMKAILWAIVFSVIIAGIMYIKQRIFTFEEFMALLFKGTGDTLSIASILIFAFAMGGLIKQLGTGIYLAGIFSKLLVPAVLPALIFFISCIISFSTGTSMGTMAVMMPLAIPLALTMDVNIALCAAAVFGGSIFGDHSSPISDTTIMSCSTTGCDVMDHVKTQLPYTLTYAAVTIILYLVLGFIS